MTSENGQVTGVTKFLKAVGVAGSTPNPCLRLLPSSASESHVDNGARGVTRDGAGVFQLAEGRVGILGQAASETLNGRTVPWIWSVIKFDASGNDVRIFSIGSRLNRQIFPTYSVYEDGVIVATFTQGDLETFIA